MFVARDKDPNVIENYQPTKNTRPQSIGYIAKLNKEKTEILNVYLDRKTASIENGYNCSSALDEPVRTKKITRGHFYMLYNNCDDELRINFENKYGIPVLYKDGVGQYDENHNLVQEFKCKQYAIEELQISDKTLRKSMEHNMMYDGFYYKPISNKLKMI